MAWSIRTNKFLTKTSLIDIFGMIIRANLEKANKVVFAAVILSLRVLRKMSDSPDIFEEIRQFNG